MTIEKRGKRPDAKGANRALGGGCVLRRESEEGFGFCEGGGKSRAGARVRDEERPATFPGIEGI